MRGFQVRASDAILQLEMGHEEHHAGEQGSSISLKAQVTDP